MRPSFGLGLVLYGASAIAQVETPARYGVGFRVVHELDRSRTVGPARDFEGRVRSGSTAVPIEIGVWYPTSVATSARRMTLGDYLVLSKLRDGDRRVTEADRVAGRDDIKSFAQFALRREINDSTAAATYDQTMSAVRNAPPLSGRFPVVIAGTDGALSAGVQLFETLARRGFVVVAAPSRASLAALQVTKTSQVIDVRIRDLEYLTAHAQQYSFVDPSRIAVLGINFDGMAALLYEMKNMRAMAVVSIDGWEGKNGSSPQVRASPLYDPLRMRVPYFVVQQDESNPPPPLAHDFTIFDALRYGDGEHSVLRGVSHAYLVGLGALYPGVPNDVRVARLALLERTAAFLDGVARGTTMTAPTTDSLLFKDHRRRAALAPVPIAEEIEQIITAPGGVERLRAIHRRARAENPSVVLFSQSTLNLFAFRLTRTQRTPEALALLELGTEAFPRSVGSRNDYGNALLQAGDSARAVQSFAQALELIRDDPELTDAERAQSRSVIQSKIDRLRARP